MYPKKAFGSQFRGFQSSWYKQYAFLEYSVKDDSAFCFVCRHFSTKITNFTTGYSNWMNALRDLKKHWSAPDHAFSIGKYSAYKTTRSSGSVASQVSSKRRENIMRNRQVLATYIEVILTCAMQEIALRAHGEKIDSRNRGNFLEISTYVKKKRPDLASDADHLPKNVQYTSPRIQNELIDICALWFYAKSRQRCVAPLVSLSWQMKPEIMEERSS